MAKYHKYSRKEFKKKAARLLKHLPANKQLRFEFMKQYQQEFTITFMAKVLEVSRSGFYGYCRRCSSKNLSIPEQ